MTTDYETITLEVENEIAVLTLNRPSRMNAFTRLMASEIIAAIDRTDADDAVRAVVVIGEGKAFCAGADLESAGATFDYANRAEEYADDFVDGVFRDCGGMVTLRIFNSFKPVVGAINGAAVGIGASMMLPMDCRIAAPNAKIGFVFTRRGIAPDGASSWFLPRIVGLPTALDWAISGRLFGAEEALQKGLFSEIHSAETLRERALQRARELIDQTAPVSVAATRRLLWQMAGAADPWDAHIADSRIIQERGAAADALEGVESFLEKRPARFPDRVSQGVPGFPVASPVNGGQGNG